MSSPIKCDLGIQDRPPELTVQHDRLTLRAFSDANGTMWKTSVKDIAGEVLCVSQFTLLANTTKGSKPDFHRAMVRPSVRPILVSCKHV